MSEQVEITPIGYTNFRNQQQLFGIKADDRRRHMYVIGKTGMGKTTLLENMVISDMRLGKGVAVVDPHGEFVEKMLDYVPSNRVQDVIYFNPSDYDFPIAFNAFEDVPEDKRSLLASGLVGTFKKIWADSWGPRLEYILRNSILSLLANPDATLLDIMRILVDKEYRKKVVPLIKDNVLKSFWTDEFSQYNQQFVTEAISPIQNKVGQFITSPLIRNVIGQRRSAFNMRNVMDEKKILLLNLSKGRIGEDNSALLGAMLITKIQLAAMSRIDLDESTRNDFYLYVDEFQNFATDSFANILSEARKYRLNLILAHQYINQLDKDRPNKIIRDAVFGNVGTICMFRVGADDAEFLEKEFSPTFMMNDLVNLAKYNIYIKLMIDGVASEPFSSTTLPTFPLIEPSSKDAIIQYSRNNYATPRVQVEQEIDTLYGFASLQPPKAADSVPSDNNTNELNSSMPITMPQSEQSQTAGNDVGKHFATCWKCGDTIKVPFQPDGKRPVFCKDCFKKAQKLKEAGTLPTISAYVAYGEPGTPAEGPAASASADPQPVGGPAKGFQALKDIMGAKSPDIVKMTRHITEPVVKPDTEAENKKVQEAKRAELSDLLKKTMTERPIPEPTSVKKENVEIKTESKVSNNTARPKSIKGKALKSGEVIKTKRSHSK